MASEEQVDLNEKGFRNATAREVLKKFGIVGRCQLLEVRVLLLLNLVSLVRFRIVQQLT